MSASDSSAPAGNGARHSNGRRAAPLGRPLARVFLRTAGLTALVAWVALLVWAAFGSVSTGSSGLFMIIGTVGSCLVVALVLATAGTHSGLRTIIAGLLTAVLAAAAGWTVYSSMPEAGPDRFITLRAGVAALAYGFGVLGGGLLALSEFVVEGYSGGRRFVPRNMRRKTGALAIAIVVMAAAALAPAMQRWAELANQDVRTGDAAEAAIGIEDGIDIASVRRFVETPHGLLRVDYPGEATPQAVTLLDPATGAAAWYHRRWNWRFSQAPVLSRSAHLTALSGPRADDPADYQTRVLRTQTGSEVATVSFEGAPGRLLAVDEDRLLYAGDRGRSFAAYDFDGDTVWTRELPEGCEGTRARMSADRLVMLADCMPAPDRAVARNWILAFDLRDGDSVWRRKVDRDSEVPPESFLVTEEAVIYDSRKEHRVTDGPFSARRFEHRLLAFDLADGEVIWRNTDESFGSTHSSACGGTLHMSRPAALETSGAAPGEAPARASAEHGERRTVQLVECFTAEDERGGARLGVMAYDAESGDRLYKRSVRLGYVPLDPASTRGWATVLPDNRTILATDRSLDRAEPDCRLYEVADGDAERLDLSEHELPEDWCRDAQLTSVAGGVAVSYVDEDDARAVFLVS
ncbi:outer membrane protein assembly factor BamB family protein [Glycomyces xiaoerkulensis]|uniref:outer membrane protein assembly factor BamB family protein n=1 Tax=Glycomyces xiaoerkulensis TaxID=2038139 RepID=UPI000C25EDA1|nr:PQQ-binding-like beta-propeller repeat protein [Glycomyces xiaoerkulensis]